LLKVNEMAVNIKRLVTGFRAGRAGQAAPLMGSFYAYSKTGPYREVFSASQVGQNARSVMEQAKGQAVLINDASDTLVLESWSAWQVKHRTMLMLEDLIPKGAASVEDMRPAAPDPSPTSDFSDEVYAVYTTAAKQPSPDFTATEVHRAYRKVLDTAKKRPVFVGHRTDLLTFDLLERGQFEQNVTTILYDILNFHVTRGLGTGKPAVEWARGTPYPWVAALPDAEIEQFANDLLPYLLESVRRESLDGFLGNLDGWQTAAQVHGSKLFREAVAATAGPSEVVEVVRPEA
jgi:hypothetical protein